MLRALTVLLMVGRILSADENSDRKAIDTIMGSLHAEEVRSDPKRMAELTAANFDGDLNLIPLRTFWCETSCQDFRVRSLKFVTTDVVAIEGETTVGIPIGATPMLRWKWLMTLTRDGDSWRISSIRSLTT